MLVYALVSSEASESVEVYLSRVEAHRALAEVAHDDAELAALLSIVTLDLERLAAMSAPSLN